MSQSLTGLVALLVEWFFFKSEKHNIWPWWIRMSVLYVGQVRVKCMRTGADVVKLVWRLVPGCTLTAAGDQQPAAVSLAVSTWCSPSLCGGRPVDAHARYGHQRRRLSASGRGRKWRKPGSDDVTCDVVNTHWHQSHTCALHLPHTYVYTVNHKKRDILFLTITLANLRRFYNFYIILIVKKFYMRL